MTTSIAGTLFSSSLEEQIQELKTKAAALYTEAAQCEERAKHLEYQMENELLQEATELSQQIRYLLNRANKISPDCFRRVQNEIQNTLPEITISEKKPPEPLIMECSSSTNSSWHFLCSDGLISDIFQKDAKYCANFHVHIKGHNNLPETLEMRLYNRSQKRLEKICTWAEAEGFVKSWELLKENSPLKKLSFRLEAKLILTHPEAFHIITSLDPKKDPPKSIPPLGKPGELFYPGDRVTEGALKQEYIISYLAPPTKKEGWTSFLINAKTGKLSPFRHHDNLKLVKAAPDFSNAFKTTPYTGLKVGDRVSLQDIPNAPRHNSISLSYWVKNCQDDELRIAAFLDDGQVALYQGDQPKGEIPIVPLSAVSLYKTPSPAPTKEPAPSPAPTKEPAPSPAPTNEPAPSATLNFPDSSKAQKWADWFSTICDCKLNPKASAARPTGSKSVNLFSLTETEAEIIKALRLPALPPNPKEAQEIWEAAEKQLYPSARSAGYK